MIKPRVDRPMLESWKVDDAKVAAFLDEVSRHQLNVRSDKYWTFRIPLVNKYLTYEEMIAQTNIHPLRISRATIEMMQETIKVLPRRLDIISEEIISKFKMLVVNRESQSRFVQAT